MTKCHTCGHNIVFRWIDGACLPLHLEGGCTGDKARGKRDRAKHSPESKCVASKCPICFNEVFFIQYNGGSVWIEPPLGPPWPKHPCMDAGGGEKKGRRITPRTSVIDSELLVSLKGRHSLLAGVVTALEVREDHKQTIVTIDVGEEESLVLLVHNSAGAFLGKIVLIDGGAKRIYHNSSRKFSFSILNSLSIPANLTSKGIKLPKLLPFVGQQQVRQTFKPKAEIQLNRLLQTFRSSHSDRLTAAQVVQIIPQLSDREKYVAEQLAATKIMLHAEKTGDCTLAARLVEVVHHSKRDRLCAWFEEHSPISVVRKKRPYKAHLQKGSGEALQPFQLERARRSPF